LETVAPCPKRERHLKERGGLSPCLSSSKPTSKMLVRAPSGDEENGVSKLLSTPETFNYRPNAQYRIRRSRAEDCYCMSRDSDVRGTDREGVEEAERRGNHVR
jgi:hypothetical protein